MIVDKTPAEIAVIDTLIQERTANGPSITNTTLQSALLTANASWKSSPEVQNVTFSGTTLGFERRGRFNYVVAEGATQTSIVNALSNTGTVAFEPFDTVTIAPKEGKWLNMQMPGQPKGILMTQEDHQISFQLVGGTWGTVSSNPSMIQAWTMPPVRMSITTATLPLIGDSVSLKYLTAETPAGGSITISTSGASGSVTAYVDEGYGAFLLGSYTYSGSPTTTAVATGLKDAIHANYLLGLHTYDATSLVAVVTVIPPQGLGSLANGYLLSTIDTGSAVSVAAGFGLANGGTDGVDGAEADGTIDTIQTPATDGMIIVIVNEMAANTITLGTSPPIDIATIKALGPKKAAMLMYSDILGLWTHFV